MCNAQWVSNCCLLIHLWFLIKLNFFFVKGRGELQCIGHVQWPGIYKGHKESNFSVSVLDYRAVTSSGPCKDLGIPVAPRGPGAAWLVCSHIVLPARGPAPGSSWSQLIIYFQLPAAEEVCPSFEVPVRTA